MDFNLARLRALRLCRGVLTRTCRALAISQVLSVPVSQAGEPSASKLDELLARMLKQEQDDPTLHALEDFSGK